jgi:hypothetical protein
MASRRAVCNRALKMNVFFLLCEASHHLEVPEACLGTASGILDVGSRHVEQS